MSYAWVLLDADGTLFDYDRAESTALEGTFAELALPYRPEVLDVYRLVNGRLWLDLEQGKTTPERIRVERFQALFTELGVDADPADFSQRYLASLARRSGLIDGAEAAVPKVSRKKATTVRMPMTITNCPGVKAMLAFCALSARIE